MVRSAHVGARSLILILLNFSAWPCLGTAKLYVWQTVLCTSVVDIVSTDSNFCVHNLHMINNIPLLRVLSVSLVLLITSAYLLKTAEARKKRDLGE